MSADMALISGIEKYLSSATFFVRGNPATAKDVAAIVQPRVDTANAAIAAAAAFHVAVETSRTTEASTDADVAGIRQQVLAMLASQPTVLAELHVSPRKMPGPRTTEEKVVAAAKAKATREARGTKGPKARLEVTGTLTGPVVIPVSPQGQPATPPAPPAAPAITNGLTPHS
jgi:hypothetical protein